jgi:ribonuclease P protein component
LILIYLANGKIKENKKIKKEEKARLSSEVKNSRREKGFGKKKSRRPKKPDGLSMLKKENRLAKIARKVGEKKYPSPLFNVRVSDNKDNKARVGFVVSKKVDKRAVVRNRTKRVLSEAVRGFLTDLGGKDVVIVAKKSLSFKDKEDVRKELGRIF